MRVTQENVVKDAEGRLWVQDFYIYVADFAALAASASATVSLSVEADSTFVWTKAAYYADANPIAAQTDSTRVIPNVLVSITDSGSGRNLQNKPVPLNCYGGHDGLPFVLPVAREFKASSSINVSIVNVSTVVFNNLKFCLIGYKKFLYR